MHDVYASIAANAIFMIPSSVLLPPMKPLACTNTQPSIPDKLLSSSSRIPRQASGRGFRDSNDTGDTLTACNTHAQDSTGCYDMVPSESSQWSHELHRYPQPCCLCWQSVCHSTVGYLPQAMSNLDTRILPTRCHVMLYVVAA